MWVVLRLQKFEEDTHNFPLSIKLDFRPLIGYLPVYDTLGDAKKEWPDGPFQEIREVEGKGSNN